MDKNYGEESRTPKKRFSLTIMGEADYDASDENGNTTFEAFYNLYKSQIEQALNSINPDVKETYTFTVKSSLSNFRLYDDIGQVQES